MNIEKYVKIQKYMQNYPQKYKNSYQLKFIQYFMI